MSASKSLLLESIPEMKQLLRGTIAISLLATLAVPCASAADASAETAGTLEEVLVTAQKVTENVQDVPISIDVLSGDTLRSMSSTSIVQSASFIPNVHFTGQEGAQIFIRGIGQTDGANNKDPGVGLYVDGVYISNKWGFESAFMDPERVEVLKGPQGTLYGMNAVGGAVNIITYDPPDHLSGFLDITPVGTLDPINIKGAIGAPLIPDLLSARVEAESLKQDGYETRLAYPSGAEIGEEGSVGQQSVRGVFELTPTKDIQVFLRVDGGQVLQQAEPRTLVALVPAPAVTAYTRVEGPPPYGPNFITGNPFTTYANGPDTEQASQLGFSLDARWNLGSWTAKSLTAYRDFHYFESRDLDQSPLPLVQTPDFGEHDHQLSQEFDFTGGLFNGRFKWVAGASYLRDYDIQFNDSQIFPLLGNGHGGTWAELRSGVDSSTAGVFAQTTTSITNKLDLVTGLRESYDGQNANRERWNAYNNAVTVPYGSLAVNYHKLTWRFALDYKVSDAVMVYTSAASGFKSGGINTASTTSFDFQPFAPENVVTYEAGLKSEMLEHRLLFNATGYYSNYSDLQFRYLSSFINNIPIYLVGNVGKARIDGFDLDTEFRPISPLTLGVSAGLADATILQINPTVGIPINNQLSDFPKFSAHVFGQYTAGTPWGQLTGRLDDAYSSGVFYTLPNQPTAYQSPYWLMNARLSLATGAHWESAIYATNLTNTVHIEETMGIFALIGAAYHSYGPPREWGAEFRYKF